MERAPPSDAEFLDRQDFDALEQSDRLQSRIEAWGKRARIRLAEAGLHYRLEELRESVGISLAGSERGTLSFQIELTSGGVDLSLRIPTEPRPAQDFTRMRSMMASAESALSLATAIESLPEPFEFGPSGETRPAHGPLRTDTLRLLLDRAESIGVPFRFGLFVSRDLLLLHKETLAIELEDAIFALVPIVKLISAVPHATHEKRANATTADDKPESRRKVPHRKGRAPREEVEETEVDVVPAPIVEPKKIVLPIGRRMPVRSSPRQIDPQAPIEPRSQVRVLQGPFEGRTGTVVSVEGRTFAKVSLGLFTAILPQADLAVLKDGRTRLASSHRKFARRE